MKSNSIRARLTDSAEAKSEERRFRNILANSGEIMESGDVRDIANLYVMGYDGELYRIADLDTNPDNQIEKYSVKAQADHGMWQDGELLPTIEKQFGSCKVWLEDDGLHARMYFANNDQLADHAWAISEDASYSIGADWYPQGYEGAGIVIDEAIGILREVSMVLTGNDPRATTIDHHNVESETEAQGSVEDSDDGPLTKEGDSPMKKLDELTPDESSAIKQDLISVVDAFTTDSAEGEAEGGAQDAKDEEQAPEQTADALRSPIVIIKDRAHQEASVATADWRTTHDAKKTFAKLAGEYRRFDGAFNAAWKKELGKHNASTEDGISGLSLPVDGRKLIINAINEGTTDSARILSHFRNLGGKSYFINLLETAGEADSETTRAHGHKKGDNKTFQTLKATPRTIYNKMTYKMLDLDAMEVYENPELISIRAEELVNNILAEWARAAIIGDGRTQPEQGQPDYRMFDGTRGFYSIAADATATTGFGAGLAQALTVSGNLYDASIEAENAITAEGGLIYVAKKDVIKDFRQAKLSNGNYLVQIGARIEDILGATAVYTPSWMQYADVDVVVFANNSYGLTGEATPTMRPDFNVITNTDILLAEAPRGGSLIAKNAAATITFGSVSE